MKHGFHIFFTLLAALLGVNSTTLATNHYTFDSGLLGVRVGSQESGGLTNGWTGQLNPLAQVSSEAWNESSLTLRASGQAGSAGSVAASLDGTAAGATLSNGRWFSDLTLSSGSHSLAASAYYPAGQFTAAVTNAFTVLSTNNVTDAFDGAGYVTNRLFASGKTQALTWDAAGRLIGLVQWNNASNGFFWTAIYDALGRRLRTSYVSVINGYTNTLLASTVDAYFDPQVEFEEVGVSLNGQRAWKVLGPDLDGHYGSLQGVGGLEATVRESDHNTTPVLNDYLGNVLATISGPAVFWNPVRVGGYGPVAGYQASPLLGSTPLADTLVWRSRGIDPGGFYNLGARYYDPVAGHFLSPDPLGHAASMDLYSFCGGDPLNRFDPTGRFAKGNFEQGYQTLQSARRAGGEAARQFDMAHEDEIQQTLLAVDEAAVCFALPVVVEGLLGEGLGAGAGMALEEGEIGGVEGFNLRSASWAARLEGSEAATFTAEGQGEFAFVKGLSETPAALKEAALAETEATAASESVEGAESAKLGSQGEQLELNFKAAETKPQIIESKGAHILQNGDVSATARTSRSAITAIRADIAESSAYNEALSRGEIGIQAPGGANVRGVDFISAGQDSGGNLVVYVNDVKSSVRGVFPTPKTQMPASWSTEVQNAVAPGRLDLGNPMLETQIRSAVQNGSVVPRQINVNYSPAPFGQGSVRGF